MEEQVTFDPNAFGAPKDIAALAAKIAGVMGALDRIPKSGHNDHFNYDFVSESAVLAAVRKELAERKVALLPYLEEAGAFEAPGKSGSIRVALALYRFTFYDGETGASLVARVQSEGMDGQDKGSAKAFTAAMKSFLLKVFLIPTGDDPGAPRAATARPAVRSSAPPRPFAAQPAPQPAPAQPSPPAPAALPPTGPATQPGADDRALTERERAVLAEALSVMGPTEARKNEGKSAVAGQYKGLGYQNYDDFIARGGRHLSQILNVAREFDRSTSTPTPVGAR